MCNPLPNTRCHPHTVAKLDSLINRVAAQVIKVAECETAMSAAVQANNSTKFMAARKRADKIEQKIAELNLEIRHTRRDMVGTPTGMAHLEQQMLASTNPRNQRILAERKQTGELKREGRKHAAAHAAAGFTSITKGGTRPPFWLNRNELATAA